MSLEPTGREDVRDIDSISVPASWGQGLMSLYVHRRQKPHYHQTMSTTDVAPERVQAIAVIRAITHLLRRVLFTHAQPDIQESFNDGT